MNPFVGLRPFERDDALVFFGRDREVSELLSLLHERRLIAILGGSGSGKSSLIQAGLIPKLQAGFLVSDRNQWQIASMRPGIDPLGNLRLCLKDLAPLRPRMSAIEDALSRRSSVDFWKEVDASLAGADANLFLLIDQFEEIFRYIMQSGNEKLKGEARDFVSICLGALHSGRQSVFLAFTMRSDFIGDCDQFHSLPEAINQGIYLVPRLMRDQFREIIEGPAGLASIPFQPELINRVLNGMSEEPDQLPILQHLLMRICGAWQTSETTDGDGPGLEHYQAAGTLRDALDAHATDSLASLDAKEAALLKRVLQFITDTDIQNRQIRRPMPLSVVCKAHSADRKDVMAAVGKFNGGGNAFLVQRMGDGQDDVELDITHESLIRKWKTLQGWVREEAGNRDQYLRLCAAASEYRNGKGELLRGARLASDAAWVKGFAPQKEWAARYTDQDSFQRAMEFLRQSTVAKRRKDLAKSALTGFAVFAAFAVLAFAYLRNVQTQREMVEQDRIKRERNLKHGEELIGKAAGLVQKGKFDSAKELLNSAESFLSQDSAGVANVHIARGLLHLSRKLNSTVTAIQDYSEADREFDLAEGIASHTSNRYIRGQALLNKGGIYRMRQLSDSALLCYQAAAASFDSAGEMGSAAEAYESEAHLLEHEYQQNKQAVDRYTDARERFRISGNLRGLTRTTEAIDSLVNYVNKSAESTKAKKIAASGTDRTPWGWLQDLATGEKFTLMSPDVKVGRNTAEIKNDIAFTDRMVSRKHLFLNSRSMASDLRSMNGTSLNALNLSYEHDVPFKSGAIFVLAGRHALLFGKSEPKDLRPAGGAWGLCIIAGNGPSSNGAYAYLSGDLESLTLRGSSLALETGTSGAALALVRGGAKGTEIKDMDDEWSLLVTVKESDYEYNQYIAKPSEWLQVDTPTMFAKLDNDRQVIQKGPAFQIVPLNAQDQ